VAISDRGDVRLEFLAWRDFFFKHGQSIARYHNVLFGLARHEGPPSMRARCDELLAQGRRSAPWVRAETAWSPPSTTTDPEIEVTASAGFPTSSSSALAAGAGIAFAVERIGSVRRYDIAQGRALQPDLDAGSRRPLALAASPDARFLAVAYDSGLLEVIRLDPGGGEAFETQRTVWRGEIRLPEYEPPLLVFVDNQLWFQAEDGTAAGLEPETGAAAARHAPPVDDPAVELRAATRAGPVLILVWRSRGASYLTRIAPGEPVDSLDAGAADVTALGPVGEWAIAVGFADRRVAIVDVSGALTTRNEITLGDHATCLAADRQSVWCLLSHGAFQAWTPKTGDVQSIAAPELKLARARDLVRHGDGTGTILTSQVSARFRLVTRPGAGVMVQAAVPTQTGYLGLATANGGFHLIDGGGRRVVPFPGRAATLYRTTSGKEVGVLFAADGLGNVLYARQDSASWWDPVSGEHRACAIPPGASALVGRERGGFWLADLAGTLYAVHEPGGYRKVLSIAPDLIAPPRLHSWGELLVWTASRLATQSPGRGQDPVYVQVFLRDDRDARAPEPIRIGEREYVAADGVLEATAFDPKSRRLVLVWQRGASAGKVVVLGTPAELAARREQLRRVSHFDGYCAAAAVDGTALYLLSSTGVLHCVDRESLEPLTTFPGSRPLTGLADGTVPQPALAAVEAPNRVLLLQCERGNR
jgi:hypothetical protein